MVDLYRRVDIGERLGQLEKKATQTIRQAGDGPAVSGGGEPALGNPTDDGFILSSTTAGVRSWVDPEDAIVAKAKRIDFVTDSPATGQTTIYSGTADPGSLESASVWRISRSILDTDDDVTQTFADGDSSFDNIWDNRLSLSYS